VLVGCSGPESYLAEGLVWATDNGADVINMSLQYFGGSALLHDAVLYAWQSGVPMIAASGNGNDPSLAFPARWDETIAVGAINNVGARWSTSPNNGSNYGPELDLMAPGVSIWSLDGVDEYKFLSGTSMAAPHVSGTVCLLESVNPGMTPEELRDRLVETAIDIGTPGFDEETGWGRLNVTAAVTGPPPVFGDLDGDGEVGIADLLLLLAAWGDCPGPCPPSCPADLDADCQVGIGDLLALLAAWG
jgi:subtilisin family serine protease